MKKLLFLPLLFLTSYLKADTITSGSVGLLIISTGVYSTRSPGDKLNSNFQIIAATITSNISQINALNSSTGNFAIKTDVANSTNSLMSAINSTATQLSNFLIADATNQNLLSSTNTWSGGNTFISSITVYTTVFASNNVITGALTIQRHYQSSSNTFTTFVSSTPSGGNTYSTTRLLEQDSPGGSRDFQFTKKFTDGEKIFLTLRGKDTDNSNTGSLFFSVPTTLFYNNFTVSGGSLVVQGGGGSQDGGWIIGSTIAVRKGGFIQFPDGTTQNTAASGSGGSSGPSSGTLKGLTVFSDMYQSTSPGTNSAHYVDYASTFNISKLWAEISIPSTYTTCSSSFTLAASSGSTGGGVIISSALQNTPLMTMNYQARISSQIAVFDPPLRILAGRELFMFQSSDPSVCGPPPRGEWGLKPWGYFDQ